MRRAMKRDGYITMVEAIVVMGLLGYFVIGLAVAVDRVRKAANRTESMNNLKQIGIAIHSANDVYNKLPPVVGPFPNAQPNRNNPNQTILFHILPYIEQVKLYQQARSKNPPWNTIVRTRVRIYLSPQDANPPPKNLYKNWLATTNYAANAQLFGFQPGGSANIARIPDGSSNTIMFTERYQMCNGFPNAWGYDAVYYWTPMFSYYSRGKFQHQPKTDDCDPALPQSLGSGGILVGMADGSVRSVGPHISPLTWQLASDPNDRMTLPGDF